VKRVVHVSTADAIGFCTSDGYGSIEKPSDETVPYQNDWLKIPYMTTKNMAQVLALSYIQKGLEVVVVNPTFMFGPWDIKPSSGQMIVQVARGMAKGYTSGGNNFVDVQDVVEGMISAMVKGRVGELYILAHENLSYREIFTKIADVVGVPPPAFQIPKFVAMTGGLFGSLYGRLFGWAGARPEAVNWTNAKMGFLGHYFTPAKAVRELGMKQTPVEVSIERSHRWFVDHGYIAKNN
jgi:dihydroflavonol-4-reductase